MLHITKLVLENFGPYKDYQEIDFSSKTGVTIIWGDNGRGKTALLNSFRFAFFGLPALKKSKSKNVINKLTNWTSLEEGKYGFKVALSFNFDNAQYELVRQFTPRCKKPQADVDYQEDVFLIKNGSVLSNSEREHQLNQLMPTEISRFFLFDGELLQEYEDLLVDESLAGVKIKDSIERILGVPVVTNSLIDVKAAEEQYGKQIGNIALKYQDTEKLGSLIVAKQKELAEYHSSKKDLETKLEQFNSKLDEIQEQMRESERVRDLLNQKKNQEDLIETWTVLQKNSEFELKKLTKIAWQGLLVERIKRSIKSLDDEIQTYQARIIEKQSRDIFIEQILEISSALICPVCTQAVSVDLLGELNKKIENISGAVDITQIEETRLLSLQSRKSQLQAIEVVDVKQSIESIEKIINNHKINISDAKQRLDEIKNSISEFDDDGSVAGLPREYQKYIELKINTENGLNDLKEKIKTETDILNQLTNTASKISTNINLQDLEKKREFCNKLIEIFESGVDKFRDNLRREVETDASDIFKRIANEPDYDHLQISTNFGLSIVHKEGRIVEIRSAGYEHIVALSLIGALHKNAPLRGPVIMDSPFGRLDPGHKEKITSVLPHLSDQIILLAYKKEIDEQSARKLLGGKLISEFEMLRVNAFHTIFRRV